MRIFVCFDPKIKNISTCKVNGNMALFMMPVICFPYRVIPNHPPYSPIDLKAKVSYVLF